MPTKRLTGGARFGAFALFLSGSVCGLSQDAGMEHYPGFPSYTSGAQKGELRIEHSNSVGTNVSFLTKKRVVIFGTRKRGADNETLSVKFERRAVAYWPTEICNVGGNDICVAGVTSQGATVIERWGLTPAAAILEIDPETGEQTWKILEPRIRSVEPFYMESAADDLLVAEMTPGMGGQ